MEDKDDTNEKGIQLLRIYDLPNEILENIFQYLELPEKLRSDEAFSGHTNVQSCLWRIFKLDVEVCRRSFFGHFHGSFPFTDLLKVLQKSGENLKTLSLDLDCRHMKQFSVVFNGVTNLINSDYDPKALLQCAIDHCNNLRLLKLSLASPLQIEFRKLIEVNKKLESILFHVSNIMKHEYLQLSGALESFPKLNKNLSVSRYKKQDDCPEMLYETFNLKECNMFYQFDEKRSFLQKLVQHNLKILRLGPFLYAIKLWTLQEMKVIAQFKNLIELHLYQMDCFATNAVMIAILKGCTKLEKIALTGYDNVTAECMNTIMTSSISLKTVELSNIAIQSILLDGAKSKVESLCFNGCTFLSAKEIEKISNFPNLKKLYLYIDQSQYDCMPVDEFNLFPISKNCQKLEEVTLMNVKSKQLTYGIASFSHLPNLRSCYFSQCDMTAMYPEKMSQSVVQLQSACGEGNNLGSHFCGSKLPIWNLRTLKIFGCNELSKSSLIEALSHMLYLETFCIDDERESMTDEVITNLVIFCRKLRTLDLEGCKAVTTSGIIALKDCHSLVTLSLHKLGIQPFSLSDLVKPNLKILRLSGLPHVPKDFVMKSITDEMRKSMFGLIYDVERLI